MDAKTLSDRIRMKRKRLKEDTDLVDTAALPKMNPQDVWQKEKEEQWEETIPNAVTPSSVAQSPVMEEPQKDDSQDVEVLKRHMEKIRRILGRLSMSR